MFQRYVHLFDFFYFLPEPLAIALARAPDLGEVSVATPNIPNYWATGSLQAVALNTKLRTITCRGFVKDFHGRLYHAGICQQVINKLSLAEARRGVLKAVTCST